MLSRTRTNLLKGVSIAIIAIHNYLHLRVPALGESEFSFKPGLLEQYFDYFLTDASSIITLLFSYLGHYGVAVFIFLSSYGLTKSLSEKQVGYTTFIRSRFAKLYPAFFLVAVVWVATGLLKGYLQGSFQYLWYINIYDAFFSLSLKLLLVSNFVPGEGLGAVGPWWFIPFIFQFYLVFPLLLHLYRQWGNRSLLAMSLFGFLVELFLWDRVFKVNINMNFLGHLPVICLGIWATKKPKIPTHMFGMSIIVFLLGNLTSYLWPLTNVTFAIIFLSLVFTKNRYDHADASTKVFSLLGRYSLYIFLINGIVRAPVYSVASQFELINDDLNNLVFAIVTVVASLLLSIALTQIEVTTKRGYAAICSK